MTVADLDPKRPATELLRALETVRRLDRRDLKGDVLELTNHPSALVREEAYSLLLSGWKEVSTRPDALAALRLDPDFGVRTTAAIGLAGVSSPQTINEDTRVLLDVVADRREDMDVRRAAYEALCLIHGRSVPPVNRAFDADRDTDAAWLASLGDIRHP